MVLCPRPCSCSSTPTNHCQEKSFRESIDQLPLHGREQLQIISLQLLLMSCASLRWLFCSTSLHSISCSNAEKSHVFQKNHRPHRSSEGWRNDSSGVFGLVLGFFFQRNSHSYAVTQHPWKTLVLQRYSPGHCCSPGSVKGRGWGLAGKASSAAQRRASSVRLEGKPRLQHKVCMYLVTGNPSTENS